MESDDDAEDDVSRSTLQRSLSYRIEPGATTSVMEDADQNFISQTAGDDLGTEVRGSRAFAEAGDRQDNRDNHARNRGAIDWFDRYYLHQQNSSMSESPRVPQTFIEMTAENFTPDLLHGFKDFLDSHKPRPGEDFPQTIQGGDVTGTGIKKRRNTGSIKKEIAISTAKKYVIFICRELLVRFPGNLFIEQAIRPVCPSVCRIPSKKAKKTLGKKLSSTSTSSSTGVSAGSSLNSEGSVLPEGGAVAVASTSTAPIHPASVPARQQGSDDEEEDVEKMSEGDGCVEGLDNRGPVETRVPEAGDFDADDEDSGSARSFAYVSFGRREWCDVLDVSVIEPEKNLFFGEKNYFNSSNAEFSSKYERVDSTEESQRKVSRLDILCRAICEIFLNREEQSSSTAASAPRSFEELMTSLKQSCSFLIEQPSLEILGAKVQTILNSLVAFRNNHIDRDPYQKALNKAFRADTQLKEALLAEKSRRPVGDAASWPELIDLDVNQTPAAIAAALQYEPQISRAGDLCRFTVFTLYDYLEDDDRVCRILSSVVVRLNTESDVRVLVPIVAPPGPLPPDDDVLIDFKIEIGASRDTARVEFSSSFMISRGNDYSWKDVQFLIDVYVDRRELPSLRNGIVLSVEWLKAPEARFEYGREDFEQDFGSRVVRKISIVKFVLVQDTSPQSTSTEEPEKKVKYYAEQTAVANALLEKATACVGDLSRFTDVQFMVYTPRFTTLQDQTALRVDNSELIRADKEENVRDIVFQYNISAIAALDELKARAELHDDILHVLIADECHWAPCREQAHDKLINDPTLLQLPNVLTLLVSATPQNCLTHNTRIKKENIVNWEKVVTDAMGEGYVTDYCGIDDYLLSMAFGVHERLVLHLVQDGTILRVIDLKLQDHYFTDFEHFSKHISRRVTEECGKLAGRQFGIQFRQLIDRHEERFFLQTDIDSDDSRYSIANYFGHDSILPRLGFQPADFSESASSTSLEASAEPIIDVDQPMQLQRLRQDRNFETLLSGYQKRFTETRREVGYKLSKEGRDRESLIASNGHLIIVDYLIALAYFAIFRVNANWFDDDSTVLCSLPESKGRVENIENIQRFLSVLKDLVVFTSKGSGGRSSSYNLTDIKDFILNKRIDSARKELERRRGEVDDDDASRISDDRADEEDCLRYIFNQLIISEGEDLVATNEVSWYTETERNVRTLLAGNPVKKGWGYMILLRISERDDNLCFQTAMRQALGKLGLVTGDSSTPLHDRKQPFSVLSDIASTRIVDHIERYFINFPLDENQQTLLQSLSKNSKRDVDYVDLNNLPCLVILCERGRLGDTFPDSFCTFDLRIRTSENLTTLIQELGRLCRYPAATLARSGVRSGDPIPDDVENALKEGKGVIVRSSDGATIGHVDTIRKLRQLIDQHGRANIDDDTGVDIFIYKFKLPCALLRTLQFERVRKAVRDYDKDNVSSINERQKPMQYLSARTIDKYLGRAHGRGNSCLARLPMSNFKAKKDHYDFENETKCDRRILLSAKCQIGKTGAYLCFIQLLREAMSPSDPLLYGSPQGFPPPASALEKSYPYWKTLQERPRLEYKKVGFGKYHRHAMEQRFALLRSSVLYGEEPADWFRLYVRTLMRPPQPGALPYTQYGEAVGATSRAWKVLKLLNDYLENDTSLASPIDDDGALLYPTSGAPLLKKVLNWDGRLDCHHPHGWGGDAAVGEEGTNDDELSKFVDDVVCGDYTGGKAPLQQKMWPQLLLGSTDGDERVSVPRRPERVFEARRFTKVSPRGGSFVRKSDFRDCVDMWSFLKSDYPEFSIPLDKIGLFEYDHLNRIIRASDFGLNVDANRGKDQEGLRVRWIFTASFNRFGPGPKQSYLDRSAAMDPLPREQYVEVLVVRKSQFENYRMNYERTHIIMSLPERMKLWHTYPVNTYYVVDPVTSGVGYSRCVSQIAAYCLGLDAIWMLDDNVTRCYSLPDDAIGGGAGAPDAQPPAMCSFTTVMQHIEKLVNRGEASARSVNNLDIATEATGKKSAPDDLLRLTDAQRKDRVAPTQGSSVPVETLADFSGHADHFGIIGIYRGHTPTWLVKERFAVTHAIYSFFLLNVKATVEHGLLYPAKSWWEDIDFVHKVDESGLIALKFNTFFHHKHFYRNLSGGDLLPVDPIGFTVLDLIPSIGSFESSKLYPGDHIVDDSKKWVKSHHIVSASVPLTLVYLIEVPALNPSSTSEVIGLAKSFVQDRKKFVNKLIFIGRNQDRAGVGLTVDRVETLGGRGLPDIKHSDFFWAFEINLDREVPQRRKRPREEGDADRAAGAPAKHHPLVAGGGGAI